jgi:ABC-type proline/glycine betaine transport system permease subunit
VIDADRGSVAALTKIIGTSSKLLLILMMHFTSGYESRRKLQLGNYMNIMRFAYQAVTYNINTLAALVNANLVSLAICTPSGSYQKQSVSIPRFATPFVLCG